MSLKRLNDGYAYTSRSAMRDQITLMSPGTPNPDGSPGTPTVFMQGVWASCRILRSPTEVNSAQLVQGETLWDVRTPYIVGCSSQLSMISPKGANWFVISVDDPDQRGVELRWMCREMTGGGVSA